MYPWPIRIVAPPAAEPISLEAAKRSLAIDPDFTEDDTLVAELIEFSRDYIEKTFDLRLVRQDVELLGDCFPCEQRIQIPLWPIQEVLYFTYQRAAGGSPVEMVEGTDFKTKLYVQPAELVLPYNGIWPSDPLDTADPIRIGLRVGYITDESPEPLPRPATVTHALRVLLGGAYENRAPVANDATQTAVRSLLANVRL